MNSAYLTIYSTALKARKSRSWGATAAVETTTVMCGVKLKD